MDIGGAISEPIVRGRHGYGGGLPGRFNRGAVYPDLARCAARLRLVQSVRSICAGEHGTHILNHGLVKCCPLSERERGWRLLDIELAQSVVDDLYCKPLRSFGNGHFDQIRQRIVIANAQFSEQTETDA